MTDLVIESDRQVVDIECDHCGAPITRITGFIDEDGAPHAAYWASCHHRDGHEVYIEAVLSPTWDEQIDDHVMFSCRVGAVEGQDTPAATLIDALHGGAQGWLTGHRLSRDESLRHDWLDAYWRVVDHILEFDPNVHSHMYGESPPMQA